MKWSYGDYTRTVATILVMLALLFAVGLYFNKNK